MARILYAHLCESQKDESGMLEVSELKKRKMHMVFSPFVTFTVFF